MGLEDLVGKFFDGVKKNTMDRYLEKASKESQSTEQKEIATHAKNVHNEVQEFNKWKVLEKEFEKEVKGLVGNELEKQHQPEIVFIIRITQSVHIVWIYQIALVTDSITS